MTGPGEDPAPLVAGSRTHHEASTGPRRRVAWRKGTDVDQQLWPIETFGGVSDEQFWDDMAADRPLASTARTAPADSGPGTQPAPAYPASLASPASRPTAADLAAVQSTVQFPRAPATPSPMTTQAYPARTQPSAAATQPIHAVQQPTGSHVRRSFRDGGPGTDEDPLTSPAYSLRAKGAVDGHSYQSSYQSGRYLADPLGPGPESAGRHGGPAADPYHGQPRSQSTQAAQSTSTSPYGDRYGYRNPVSRADDLTSATGSRGHGRPGGNGTGEGRWDSYRSHPPAHGYPGPYDPRGNGRG